MQKAGETDASGLRELYYQWYPLALSRILINGESLLVTVFLIRMPSPLLTLAAFAGLVYPVMFLIESPTWMFLSTSTALSKCRQDFHTLLHFAQGFALLLSLPMLLIVFSPFYSSVLEFVLGAEGALIEYSRLAFLIAVPWVLLTADRRVFQGLLIRAGYSKALLRGTLIRLLGMLLVLLLGLYLETQRGAAWGAAAITVGLLLECLYVRWVFQRASLGENWDASPVSELTPKKILNFYAPLALDGFFLILRRPIGSAAMLRLPFATESLAIVGAVYSFVQCLVAIALSLLEILVSYIERIEKRDLLWRFASLVSLSLGVFLLLLVTTPLQDLLLGGLLGLGEKLHPASSEVLILFSPIPVLLAFHKYYEALAITQARTKFIIQATLFGLLFFSLMILCLSLFSSASGAHIFAFSLSSSVLINVLYLRSRVR